MDDQHTTHLARPDLQIPPSRSIVNICLVLGPSDPGLQWLPAPIFSFLIRHQDAGRTLVFDLGIRKDWQNLSPNMMSLFKTLGWTLQVEKGVHEILDEGGIDTSKIEATILSHHHFDHTGDPSTFDPSTNLIVGPGFKECMLPGYPANTASPILESDYTGRNLVELDFTALFFLLDSPGHTVGHICGLARGTSAPSGSSFVLMSGDAFHHAAGIRLSPYLSLPKEISPDPFSSLSPQRGSGDGCSCPGSVFESLLPNGLTQPFYEPARLAVHSFHHDVDELVRTVGKLQEMDAHDSTFVAAAHDESLLDVVSFFPASTANDFAEKGWVPKCRWMFLLDFAEAVDRGGEAAKKRQGWAPL
ncbi:hypothetical protein B0H63DRAFT_494993 [Podospora didyma]|uniref:Metallo-beta-lactamase domain-containing protein n=1 Tax=Podospora didyma TaxID=330526 RepID=A0AAE0NGJ2_9PEZI|nr:hypothetical protein B0H63DRAFT_494993 [Podospora didyma]